MVVARMILFIPKKRSWKRLSTRRTQRFEYVFLARHGRRELKVILLVQKYKQKKHFFNQNFKSWRVVQIDF